MKKDRAVRKKGKGIYMASRSGSAQPPYYNNVSGLKPDTVMFYCISVLVFPDSSPFIVTQLKPTFGIFYGFY
jgi:hypothetical protein